VLHQAFVESDYYPKDNRRIVYTTFKEHLTDMKRNVSLVGDTLRYFEACKDQEQARRSRGGV
jgi:hypothetical protein